MNITYLHLPSAYFNCLKHCRYSFGLSKSSCHTYRPLQRMSVSYLSLYLSSFLSASFCLPVSFCPPLIVCVPANSIAFHFSHSELGVISEHYNQAAASCDNRLATASLISGCFINICINQCDMKQNTFRMVDFIDFIFI